MGTYQKRQQEAMRILSHVEAPQRNEVNRWSVPRISANRKQNRRAPEFEDPKASGTVWFQQFQFALKRDMQMVAIFMQCTTRSEKSKGFWIRFHVNTNSRNKTDIPRHP